MYGYDIYTVSVSDVEPVTYQKADYTGSSRIYNGGFIAVVAGNEIAPEDIASTGEEAISVTVDKQEKKIIVTNGIVSGVKNIETNALPSTIHDLTGRKLQEITTQGIYIVNGRKVLKK